MQEHVAPLALLDAQHVHGGLQAGVVDAVEVQAHEARDDAPLVPGADEALPRGPEFGGEFVVLVPVLSGRRLGGLGRRACLVGVYAEACPLGAQIGVFLLCGLSPPPAQEVVADGTSEFFSTPFGLSAASRAFM